MLNWVSEIPVERVEASYWVRRTGENYPHLEIVTLCVVDGFVSVIVGAALFPVISHADTSWRPVDKNGCLVQYPEFEM